MSKKGIHVYSEIGKLKTVMLHRPGAEIENLIPEYLERLLFDDIPFLKVAREEHDNFARVLQDNGVEVLYLEKLAAEALMEEQVKDQFLNEVISECNIGQKDVEAEIKKFLLSMPEKAMVDKIMAGIRKKEIGIKETYEDYPFIMDPLPNLYFTRDPFACMGSGVSLNTMRTETRNRETIFGKYIFKYHPDYRDSGIKLWYDRGANFAIEGGDELVLSKDVLAIGASERTDAEAVKTLAKNIFEAGESFKTVLIFHIPVTRAFMHLDTVFTMIDYDKFTVHPGIEGSLKVTALTYDASKKEVIAKEEEGTLEQILSNHLNKDITVIRCGGGDKIIAGREQWNDGSNTLAIAPGTVVTYERNYITNELLDQYNVKVLPIASAELSRGRGGPRCMSMPFVREDIE
ncbi:arginine deiminase [Hathewaya histolytica]|uniref:Arginine deiminase n=1 Tax=Hathewaya histolytica TaxID=1498 RepID=A0A4U9QX57_HATHI|nr:arginine deiminase [Hathewaya histolytica]VTQ82688.1 arginine deiminase [Hathewaya histolytica]